MDLLFIRKSRRMLMLGLTGFTSLAWGYEPTLQPGPTVPLGDTLQFPYLASTVYTSGPLLPGWGVLTTTDLNTDPIKIYTQSLHAYGTEWPDSWRTTAALASDAKTGILYPDFSTTVDPAQVSYWQYDIPFRSWNHSVDFRMMQKTFETLPLLSGNYFIDPLQTAALQVGSLQLDTSATSPSSSRKLPSGSKVGNCSDQPLDLYSAFGNTLQPFIPGTTGDEGPLPAVDESLTALPGSYCRS